MASLPEYDIISNPLGCGHLAKKTRRSHNLTLVLDLDETLIHSSYEQEDNFDFKANIEESGEIMEVMSLA